MKLHSKITFFSASLTFLLIISLGLVSLFSFRQFSITMAEGHLRTTAEIIRVNLTEFMLHGIISKREQFLKRVTHVQGLERVHIVRGEAVVKQHGPGLREESSPDTIEKQVLATGVPYFDLISDSGLEVSFRSTIPYIATNKLGEPQCLQCHAAEVGDVLGAVTLVMSLTNLKANSLIAVATMIVTILLFTGIALFFFRRMISPLLQTTQDIQEAVSHAREGRFDTRIDRRSDDEIGQIADEFNQLGELLHENLTKIRNNTSQLIRTPPPEDSNLLHSTSEMFQWLIAAAHFKQSIEEDETQMQVYSRLAHVIESDFHIKRFSIYEVDNEHNTIKPIIVNGEPTEECQWCNVDILIRPKSCRAKRTGHPISSLQHPRICEAFSPKQNEPSLYHCCIPIIQSGGVGSILQLVFESDVAEKFHKEQLTFLNIFLREASTVIEAKRLMESLRDANLSDAMTGLRNRRFLEEYAGNLVAEHKRRKAEITVMMLDLDHFKKVNDTYGHDVGDTVLKSLANVLKESVRNSDLVIRYGGEEFIVILIDSMEEGRAHVSEKIRSSVEALKIPLPGGGVLKKTISIGCANFPRDGESFWEVAKCADLALYAAKEGGRNQVVDYNPETLGEE